MKLLDEFVKRVFKESGSFSLKLYEGDFCYYYHFMQSDVGKAKYIYAMESFKDELFTSKLDLKPILVSIVCDGVVYVVDKFFFKIYLNKDVELPQNAILLSTVVSEQNEYMNTVIIPKFYNELKTSDISISNNDILECKTTARSLLLNGKNVLDDLNSCSYFNNSDIAKLICGFVSVEELAYEKLKFEEHSWVCKKKTEELMKGSEIVTDFEMNLAMALSNIDAKLVTVTFESGGKSATTKLNKSRIIYNLIHNYSFNSYDFDSSKCYDELLKSLNLDFKSGYTVLNCKYISKITYRKQTLYEM